MNALDHRLNAYSAALADGRLRDKVTAAAYTEGAVRQVTAAVAPMHRQAGGDAAIESQVLFGETVRVFDESDGWAWCQLETDGYVGFVPRSALGPDGEPATHRVAALLTPLYPEAELRRPPLKMLSIGSRVTITGTASVRDLDYALLADGSAVAAGHLLPLGETIGADYVSVAEGFSGLPYLWAGRSGSGVDCSGLVQLARMMTGSCPLRDSDMQEKTLGTALDISRGLPPLIRSDLVFWQGHVGIMSDSDTLLHASGRAMSVVKDPVGEVVARLESRNLPVTSIRRFSDCTAPGLRWGR